MMQRTHHLNVPYYVRETFKKEYQGSLHRLESNIEEEYIMVMKQNCLRERSYRKFIDISLKFKTNKKMVKKSFNIV